MKYMRGPQGLLVAVITGGVLGGLASKLLFLQWFTLLPWGVAAVAMGFWSPSRRAAVSNGLAFGFALGLLFMIGGYSGSDPVMTKLPFFAVLGALSAVVAAAMAVSTQRARDRLRHGA